MYFQNFPPVLYTFKDPATGQFDQAVNIFARVVMLQSILNNIGVFYEYAVKDSDTPEIIAAKYYNDPNRHWIVLFANQIIDPYFQWPLSQNEFEQNLIANFGSIANSQATIHHYELQTTVTVTLNYQVTTNTYISNVSSTATAVDGVPFANFPTIAFPVVQVGANNSVTFPDTSIVSTGTQLVAVSNYEQFFVNNENNRNIVLVQANYIPQIEAELQNLLSQ